jgi:hypothetical protein
MKTKPPWEIQGGFFSLNPYNFYALCVYTTGEFSLDRLVDQLVLCLPNGVVHAVYYFKNPACKKVLLAA